MKTTLTVLLIINLYGLTSCAIKDHYYINQQKTWDDALLYCRDWYHDLSTFTNETEVQCFLEFAGDQNASAWVGLGKESVIRTWAGGKGTTPRIWHDIPPNDGTCAYLSSYSYSLHFGKCKNEMPFFCMTTEFVVIQQSESWEGALEYCRDHYDDLASLSSNRSMTDALSKISGAQTQYVWIGLRFLAGEWFWINGDDVEYQVWSSAGQPQCPARNQRCAALDKNTKTWTNRDCEEKLNFLCF